MSVHVSINAAKRTAKCLRTLLPLSMSRRCSSVAYLPLPALVPPTMSVPSTYVPAILIAASLVRSAAIFLVRPQSPCTCARKATRLRAQADLVQTLSNRMCHAKGRRSWQGLNWQVIQYEWRFKYHLCVLLSYIWVVIVIILALHCKVTLSRKHAVGRLRYSTFSRRCPRA